LVLFLLLITGKDIVGITLLLSVGEQHQLKDFARQFYSSKAWQKTREAYGKSKRNLCEVCLAKGIVTPAEIIHHKIELTPQNITDPSITLDWNNLQCVCRECHAVAHGARQNRWKLDELGRVIFK
jgi:hypothetical protein